MIQEILGHLDARKRDSPRVRAGIIQALLQAVAIAAKGSIGQKHKVKALGSAALRFGFSFSFHFKCNVIPGVFHMHPRTVLFRSNSLALIFFNIAAYLLA